MTQEVAAMFGQATPEGHLPTSPLLPTADGELDLQLFEGRLIRRAGDGDALFLLILAQRRRGIFQLSLH